MVLGRSCGLDPNLWVWYSRQFLSCQKLQDKKSYSNISLLFEEMYMKLKMQVMIGSNIWSFDAVYDNFHTWCFILQVLRSVSWHPYWYRKRLGLWKMLRQYAHYLLTTWRFNPVQTKKFCDKCIFIWLHMMMIVWKHS